MGYIVGDCPGVGYEPYETSTAAADAYLQRIIIPELKTATHNLRVLRSPQGPPWLYFEHYDVATRRVIRNPRTHEPETIKLTRDEADALARQLPSYERDRYAWDHRLGIAIANQETHLDFWTREQTRLESLIAEWMPRPLRTIEQEVRRQEQGRAERQTSKTATRDKRISDEVAKIQKRIDAAVRNKNSATLADIYASQKLRDLSGFDRALGRYRLSRDEAIALLDRDEVWRAFGLLTSDGYLHGESVKDLLDDMTWGAKVPTTRPGLRYEHGPMPWPESLGGGTAKTRD